MYFFYFCLPFPNISGIRISSGVGVFSRRGIFYLSAALVYFYVDILREHIVYESPYVYFKSKKLHKLKSLVNPNFLNKFNFCNFY